MLDRLTQLPYNMGVKAKDARGGFFFPPSPQLNCGQTALPLPDSRPAFALTRWQTTVGRFAMKCRTRFIISSASLRDGCWYCGKPFDEIQLHVYRYQCDGIVWDHIIPRYLGGSNVYENLIPACMSCNSNKSKKTLREYRACLREQGISSDFDTPDPYSISGWLISDNYKVMFISDDGSTIVKGEVEIYQLRTSQFVKNNIKWIKAK